MWRAFSKANGCDPGRVSEGANYLRACESATGLHAEEAAAFAEGIRDVLAGRRATFEMEYPCHSPTERRWFMGRVTPYFCNEKAWAVVAHENTTERKLAEEALRDQKVQLETILDQAADAIIVCDDRGRFTFANAAARRMALQDSEGTTLDINPEVWGVAHYTDGRRVPLEEWPISRALQGETTLGREVRMIRPDGSHYDALISAAPLNNADGDLVGAVAGLLDITEYKRAEEERDRLRQQEIEVRAQNEERRRIARDLHDVVLQDLSGALQSLRLTHLRSKNAGPGLELEEELEALGRVEQGVEGPHYISLIRLTARGGFATIAPAVSFDVLKVTTTSVVQEGWVITALVVVQIALLAATIGAFAFMLSSLWATLRVTFVGLPESEPEDTQAEESPDDVRS